MELYAEVLIAYTLYCTCPHLSCLPVMDVSVSVPGKFCGTMSSSLAASETQFEVPWVEKYRPLMLDDVVGNEHAVGRLRVISQEGNLPNVILAGPPGTGKTTSIAALARTMLGDAYKVGGL